MILLVGGVLTTVLSLSIHVVMLQVLHVPYPEGHQNAAILPLYGNYTLSILAALWLYRASHHNLTRFSFFFRWLILFVLLAMLEESLIRAPLMSGIVTSAWLYAMLQAIPELASSLMLAFLIVSVAPRLNHLGSQLVAALLISSALYFVWTPFVTQEISKVMSMVPQPNEADIIPIPYGWNVLIPAYLTYGEPVVACFILAGLSWRNLATNTITRICQFVLMILLVKKGLLLAPIIYAFYSDQPFVTGLLSIGQFSLEALALATFTAITWHLYLSYRNMLPA